MIIESVDALKSWLAKLLEPICDADPSALANYVVALVKKDKPEKELKAFCADQLDVFLQKETSGFVDKLFESLYTKSYLPSAEPTKAEAKPAGQEKEEVKEECVKQNFQESVEEERESRKKKYSSPQRSRTDSSEQRTREKKRDDGKWRDYDRYYDRSDLYREKSGWRRGRSKSRSKSRGMSRSRSRSRGRSKDRDGSRSDTYEPDGYNPEAPSITSAGRSQYRQFFTRAQMQRPNLIGLTSGEMDTNPRAANIIIQTEPPIPITNNSSNVTRVVLEPDSRKRSPSSMECPPLKKPWLGKQVNNNQNKPGFLKKNQYTNTKLEVRKIPPELNNITQLNEHFSKFGTIVNIQVAFQNDPEAALIQYLSNDEARKAISSTEAVLSNRFIRVLWHRESEQQPSLLQQQQQQPPTPQALQHLQQQALATPPAVTVHSSLAKVMNKPLASGAYVLNKVPVKRRLGAAGGSQPELSQPGAGAEESQIFPTSTSHSKMVYSSPNLKTTLKSGAGSKPHDVQEALKKKQEAMKLQQDMRKKKQEMLEKQIECQKMLISKLEKNKAMKPEERAEIMKTLKELTGKISQLKDELKTSSTTSTPSKLKSKTEAQKELLDAELDFHKRLSSGEDTTELRKKLNQLQVEAARLGILPVARGKAVAAPGRGRGRGRGGRGRGVLNHMVVDHRPKALTVGGFVEEEKDELLQHFSKFGDIEDLQEEDSPLSVVVTFKSRSEAENAANQGSRFKDRRLQISWHKPKVPSVSTEVEEEESKEEETETSDLFLHEDDDDDDEDEDESRSWRR
ncbi:hypothetical protein DUI87_26596 [Hirundo rustica rustica]|uniref:RRM domain-containing protein n=1 Tax=Hirundo rustica rustica TaxID=333673 RepID=A0A3M0JCA5_HIRRU|nr:hypothetical protein DUI87_26596 [Hirundo rustica rustica]